MTCINLVRSDTKNLLEEQVLYDSVFYMREERLNSQRQNIHLQSVPYPTIKYVNDFQDVPKKLNNDQPQGSIPNTCDSVMEITKQDKENVNDELTPLTFVAVSPDSVKKEMEECHDDMGCFDLVLNDPLGEYSGVLNVTKNKSVKKECTSQSKLEVKNEPKDGNDVLDSEMSEDVLIADKLTHINKFTTTARCPFLSCYQESGMGSNADVMFRDTSCSESCAYEETPNMEIKFESICEIFEADVKEEKIFGMGRCWSRSEGDDAGTAPLKPQNEVKTDDHHFSSIDLQQDVNEEGDADASKISSPFCLESGNKTPGERRSAVLQINLGEDRKKLMEGTGSNSTPNTSSSTKKQQRSNQHLVPRESFLLHPARTMDSSIECDFCKKIFRFKSRLQVHIAKHTGEKPFKCDICKKVFGYVVSLKKHMRIHTDDKTFECEICKKKFYSRKSLAQHTRIHTGQQPFQCKNCSKSFSCKSLFEMHMRSHSGEKPFECKICKSSFIHVSTLKRHLRAHNRQQPFQCKICSKSFVIKSFLKMHMLSHSGEKPFVCEICKSSFNRANTLKRHKFTHTNEKQFQCEICKRKFKYKCSLKMHIESHAGDKTTQCVICKKICSCSGSLTQHMLIHSGQQPFQCKICPKSFCIKNSLKKHMRSHSEEKPFECEICNSSFNFVSSLNRHKLSHTNEKQYQCDICKNEFKYKCSLKIHMETHSGD